MTAWTLGAWALVASTEPGAYEEPSFAQVADAQLEKEVDKLIWAGWLVGFVVIVVSVIVVARRQLTRGH